jgi:predicted methyltransferase
MMLPQYQSMPEAVCRAALRPGDIAVDIGANVGRHTLPVARAVGSSGKVIAFKPLPTAYPDLCRSVETVRSADAVRPHSSLGYLTPNEFTARRSTTPPVRAIPQ